jgi:hypothetical protein
MTALDPRFRGGDDKWLVMSDLLSVRYLEGGTELAGGTEYADRYTDL